MTITFPLTLPSTPKLKSFSLTANNVVAKSTSPFTLTMQVYKHPGQQWMATFETAPMTLAQANAWKAFLVSLNGPYGTFLAGDPDNLAPRGVATGTPLVDGAAQTGAVLNTKGWTTGVTGILLAGDMIQIGNFMYMVLADTNSNGSGLAAVDVWPNLRASPADGAAIIISNTKTRWRLDKNSVMWRTDSLHLTSLTFNALEDVGSS